jgi:hypothetical protein
MRIALTATTLAVFACSKSATPGKLSDFEPEIGSSKFRVCTAENDGKRFLLEGCFVVDGDIDVDDWKTILRRGPNKSVAVIGWDRTNDTFSVGQWLPALNTCGSNEMAGRSLG